MSYSFHPAMLKGPQVNPPPGDVPLVVFIDSADKQLKLFGFDGTDWAEYGIEFPIASATVRPSLAVPTETRVCQTSAVFTQLRTLDLDEEDYSWTLFGSDSISGSTPSISALGETEIAHYALFGSNGDGRLQTLEHDGTNWAPIGNAAEISDGSIGSRAGIVVALTATRVVQIDTSSKALRTYDFDGTDWTQTGNSFTLHINPLSKFAACRLSDDRIAYIDQNTDELKTFEFDGTDWTQVGNALPITAGVYAGSYALAMLSDTQVGLFNGRSRVLQAYSFDDTDWTALGNSRAVLVIEPAAEAMTASPPPPPPPPPSNPSVILEIWSGTYSLRMMRFSSGSWSQVGTDYDTDTSTITSGTMPDSRVVYWDFNAEELNLISVSSGGAFTLMNTQSMPGADFEWVVGLTNLSIITWNGTLLRPYEYSGGSWSSVGSGLAFGGSVAGIAAMSATRFATTSTNDFTSFYLYCYDIDNAGEVSQVGSPFGLPGEVSGIASISANEVVVSTGTGSAWNLRTYQFDGSTWTEVADPIPSVPYPAPAALSNSSLARLLTDFSNPAVIQKYDLAAGEWIADGSPFNTLPLDTYGIRSLSHPTGS
jgi:hypothetical protein